MKYIKTYENLKDMFTGSSVFFIITDDEKYVAGKNGSGNYAEGGLLLHPIKALDAGFNKTKFVWNTEEAAQRKINQLLNPPQWMARRMDASAVDIRVLRTQNKISATTFKVVEYIMGAMKSETDPDLGLDDENLGMDI